MHSPQQGPEWRAAAGSEIPAQDLVDSDSPGAAEHDLEDVAADMFGDGHVPGVLALVQVAVRRHPLQLDEPVAGQGEGEPHGNVEGVAQPRSVAHPGGCEDEVDARPQAPGDEELGEGAGRILDSVPLQAVHAGAEAHGQGYARRLLQDQELATGVATAAWQPALAQTGVKIWVWICEKVKAVPPGSSGGSVGDFTVPQPASRSRSTAATPPHGHVANALVSWTGGAGRPSGL